MNLISGMLLNSLGGGLGRGRSQGRPARPGSCGVTAAEPAVTEIINGIIITGGTSHDHDQIGGAAGKGGRGPGRLNGSGVPGGHQDERGGPGQAAGHQDRGDHLRRNPQGTAAHGGQGRRTRTSSSRPSSRRPAPATRAPTATARSSSPRWRKSTPSAPASRKARPGSWKR